MFSEFIDDDSSNENTVANRSPNVNIETEDKDKRSTMSTPEFVNTEYEELKRKQQVLNDEALALNMLEESLLKSSHETLTSSSNDRPSLNDEYHDEENLKMMHPANDTDLTNRIKEAPLIKPRSSKHRRSHDQGKPKLTHLANNTGLNSKIKDAPLIKPRLIKHRRSHDQGKSKPTHLANNTGLNSKIKDAPLIKPRLMKHRRSLSDGSYDAKERIQPREAVPTLYPLFPNERNGIQNEGKASFGRQNEHGSNQQAEDTKKPSAKVPVTGSTEKPYARSSEVPVITPLMPDSGEQIDQILHVNVHESGNPDSTLLESMLPVSPTTAPLPTTTPMPPTASIPVTTPMPPTIPANDSLNNTWKPGYFVKKIFKKKASQQTTTKEDDISRYIHKHGKKNKTAPPLCDFCQKTATEYIRVKDMVFHRECFRCMGCHELISPAKMFVPFTSKDNERFHLHYRCYYELFGDKCRVCSEPLSGDPSLYASHPFFKEERVCMAHINVRPYHNMCQVCHRYEPIGNAKKFISLGDAGRYVCESCCGTYVVDNAEAKQLWVKVIHFFEHVLELPIWEGMRDIPILMVEYATLNEQMTNKSNSFIAHNSSRNILDDSIIRGESLVRGLCMSEHFSGQRLVLNDLRFDPNNRSFSSNQDVTYFRVPDPSKTSQHNSCVTAILCLSGLPADLTASILAHEALHAWFKLHPEYSPRKEIPGFVEEGCCQLISHMFLKDELCCPSEMSVFNKFDLDDIHSNDRNTHAELDAHICSSDARNKKGFTDMRPYFRFCIEVDKTKFYGDGFRKAKEVVDQIGHEVLLSHIAMYKEFPIV